MSTKDAPMDVETASIDEFVAVRRRGFIGAAVGVGFAAIAGCAGDGASDEGGSGNGAGEGDGTGAGGEGGGDANGGGDGDGAGDANGHSDLPEIEVPESYVAEMRFVDDESTEDTGSTVYEVHGENLVFYQEGSKDESASYLVDGDIYQVLDDQCMMMDDEEQNNVDSEAPEFQPSETHSYEQVGTETIDGVEHEVYRQDGTEDYRIYIDTETNYVRRLQTADAMTTTDFHSFDEVDPIEPPDMECQNVSGGG